MRVLLLDGKQHGLVFGPAATADHLVAMLREKIGLSDAATGQGLFIMPLNKPSKKLLIILLLKPIKL